MQKDEKGNITWDKTDKKSRIFTEICIDNEWSKKKLKETYLHQKLCSYNHTTKYYAGVYLQERVKNF